MTNDYYLNPHDRVWSPHNGCCLERDIQMLKRHVAALEYVIEHGEWPDGHGLDVL